MLLGCIKVPLGGIEMLLAIIKVTFCQVEEPLADIKMILECGEVLPAVIIVLLEGE